MSNSFSGVQFHRVLFPAGGLCALGGRHSYGVDFERASYAALWILLSWTTTVCYFLVWGFWYLEEDFNSEPTYICVHVEGSNFSQVILCPQIFGQMINFLAASSINPVSVSQRAALHGCQLCAELNYNSTLNKHPHQTVASQFLMSALVLISRIPTYKLCLGILSLLLRTWWFLT